MRPPTLKYLRPVGLVALGAIALSGFGLTPTHAAGKPVFAPPYDVEIFVRGTFNGWGLGHEMKFDAVDDQYIAYVELVPGGHEFKIASEDWATVDLGYADDGFVEISVPEPVTTVTYNNLYLEVADAAVYSFKLDVSDPDHLSVLVEYARPGGDGSQVYVQTFPGVMWNFGCLGAANPVVGAITIKGALHERLSPEGGFIYRDMQQIKGIAYDQNGVEYRTNQTRPLVYNGKPDGVAFTFTEIFRAKWTSQGGTPDLYMIYHYNITVGPAGDVKQEFFFYEDGCQ